MEPSRGGFPRHFAAGECMATLQQFGATCDQDDQPGRCTGESKIAGSIPARRV